MSSKKVTERNSGMDSRTTLQDVADLAGVSRTTASFVLNERDDMRISDAAQRRVRRAARELDYRPNLTARSLKTHLTHTVALLSDTVVTDGSAGEMIRGAVEASIAAGHMLYMGEFEGDGHVLDELVTGFLDRQVDGFVFASSFATAIDLPASLEVQPVVMLNCIPKSGKATAVISDDYLGARQAGAHLLELGHSDGVWLVGETPHTKYVAHDRRRGVEDALAEGGVPLSGTIACKWWPESAFEAVSAHLRTCGPPQAMVCLNDRVAMGAQQALTAGGWSVPDDVTLIGFDNSPIAGWLQPPLTSVAMPYHRMGVRAIELLLTGNLADGIHRLPMTLHVRGSSAPPRP